MNGLRNRKALYRTSHRRCSIKRSLGKSFAIFTGKHLCWSLFSIKLRLQLYQKETSTQVFSCKYCDIFSNIFFATPMDDCFY